MTEARGLAGAATAGREEAVGGGEGLLKAHSASKAVSQYCGRGEVGLE